MPTIKGSAFSCSARYKAILYTRWICSQPWAGSSNPTKRCRTCAYTSDNICDSLVFASMNREQFPFSPSKKGQRIAKNSPGGGYFTVPGYLYSTVGRHY